MARIYCDTNVFSNLEANTLPDYQKLTELLLKYSPNLTFVFSHAHIRDKRKAERKVDYFKFLESFVGDNHISYHATEKQTSFYLTTPMMVHNDDMPDGSTLSFFKDDETEEDPILSSFKKLNEVLLSSIPANIDLGVLSTLPEEDKVIMSEIIPIEKENITMYDMAQQLASFTDKINEDNGFYKLFRKYLFDRINNGKYDANMSNTEFNELFKDSIFQKSFLDFVKDSMHVQDKTKIPYYDFYLQCYSMLDMLGISRDEIKGKNGYKNIFNDSLHSYYAQYCDCLVTEDKGMTKKSKILYEMLGINTHVLSVKEFLDNLPAIGENTEENIEHIFKKITDDINNGLRTEPTKHMDQEVIFIDSQYRYFNHFDQLVQVINDDDSVYLVLLKRRVHSQSKPIFREISSLIDRCLRLMGPDGFQLGAFKFEEEIKQINNDNWEGRYWKADSIVFSLKKNDALGQVCLHIGPFMTKKPEDDVDIADREPGDN